MTTNEELRKMVEELQRKVDSFTAGDRSPNGQGAHRLAPGAGLDPKELLRLRTSKLPWGRVLPPAGVDDDLSSAVVTFVINGVETGAKVSADGVFELPPPKSPLKSMAMTVRADPLALRGRTYEPDPPAQTLYFDADGFDGVAIPYRPARAEIRVVPHLRDTVGAPRPMSGVTVELFAGPDTTKRLRSLSTSTDRPRIEFPELAPGLYTLVTSGPPVYDGMPVRMVDGRNRVRRVQVDAGQVLELATKHDFEPVAVGDVEATVLDDDTDAPLDAVEVELASVLTDQQVRVGTTAAPQGTVLFQDLPAGSYVVRLTEPVVSVGGRRWTLERPALASIRDGDPRPTRVRLRLRPDEHVVYGPVLDADDTPLPHVRLVARSYPDGEELATFVSDERGEYRWVAPHPGTFSIAVSQVDGEPERLVPVSVNSSVQNPVRVDGHPRGGGTGAPGSAGLRRGVLPAGRLGGSGDADGQAFPLLVDEVDLAGSTPRGRAGRVGGGAGSGQVVESALRDVLGYRPRKEDPRGFLAALSQAFSCYEVRGHRECKWTPRGYAATVQADLGALTGAQASIYERAKIVVEAALPILDRLRPLDPSADEENVGALRAIVRSRLEELPRELGVEGGPRVLRVDDLFIRLLGGLGTPVTVEGLPPDSELGQLREDLGMDRTRINTIDEEANFTDFLMLVDHIGTLLSTWVQQRAFFDRVQQGDEQPFLGTQLVLLSRQLEVVAETVGETYFVMDSVFLGAAERQTLELRFPLGASQVGVGTRITVAELLDWVESFATEEGPRLIREGGISGVRSFAPTVETLAGLVDGSLVCPQDIEGTPLPASYRTARVQQALTQLAQQLDAAAALAGAFQVAAAPDPVPRRRGGRR
jgi:hypothetical protein